MRSAIVQKHKFLISARFAKGQRRRIMQDRNKWNVDRNRLWLCRSRFTRMPLLLSIWTLISLPAASDTVSFNRDVRAILSDRCFQCHGPNEETRQAELRLDVADDREGPFHDRDGHRVITPKDLQASAIWQRLTTNDDAERMPPAESNVKPLTSGEKQVIRQWILNGAQYEDFWAFVSPQRPTARTPQIHSGTRPSIVLCWLG